MSTNVKLKIKNKSLEAEARIIRKEEVKLRQRILHHRRMDPHCRHESIMDINHVQHYRIHGGWTLEAKELLAKANSLSQHRRKDVRMERRASHLAYCFLRGTPYEKVEQSTHSRPSWERVTQLVKRYCDEEEGVVLQRLSEWKQACPIKNGMEQYQAVA